MDCLPLSLGADEREQLFRQVSSFGNHVRQRLTGKSMKNPARSIVRPSASRTAIRFMDFQVWFQRNASTRTPRRRTGRNSGSDGGAFARGGLDLKTAADHFQAFPDTKQSEVFASLPMQYAIHLKGFAVIFYLHANAFRQFLDDHFHPAGLGMPGHIGERFLGDPKEHRSFGVVRRFNNRRQPD
jgi:hypothetical protein